MFSPAAKRSAVKAMEKQKERRKSRKEVMSDLLSNPSSVSKYYSTLNMSTVAL